MKRDRYPSAAGGCVMATLVAAAPALAQLPLSAYNVYRGNTHAHTVYTWSHGSHWQETGVTLKPDWDQVDYSNHQGPPTNHFQLARQSGYDFYVTTDHSQEDTLNPVDPTNNAAWLDTLAAAQANTDGQFVAMPGFEFSRNSGSGGRGHLSAINTAGYVNAQNTSIEQFYDWLKTAAPAHGRGQVVAAFNHPDVNQFNDWAYRDDTITDIITLFELRTVYRGQPRWAAYIRALNKGWKVAPIGILDNHDYWSIENRPPLTAVLATERTTEAITEAMRQRRTFVSWNDNVELKYAVNGAIMGSTITRDASFDFQIEIATDPGEPDQKVRLVQILRDHPDDLDQAVLVAEAFFDEDDHTIAWTPTVEDVGADYFLVRAFHENDMYGDGTFGPYASTYAAPVWVSEIPEPGALGLMGAGGWAALMRRSRRARPRPEA